MRIKAVKKLWFAVVLLLAVWLLSACAVLQPNFQKPSVAIVALQPLSNNGLEQRFKIDLRVTNPNASALSLIGMSYAIELEGYKVISGVANSIPKIAAYGEAVVSVESSVNLLASVKFFASVLAAPKAEWSYHLSAKLDTGLPILGLLAVEDTGVIALSSW